MVKMINHIEFEGKAENRGRCDLSLTSPVKFNAFINKLEQDNSREILNEYLIISYPRIS